MIYQHIKNTPADRVVGNVEARRVFGLKDLIHILGIVIDGAVAAQRTHQRTLLVTACEANDMIARLFS